MQWSYTVGTRSWERKLSAFSYSKSKPTAVGAGRHEFWIARTEREGNRKEQMQRQKQHSESFCKTAVTTVQERYPLLPSLGFFMLRNTTTQEKTVFLVHFSWNCLFFSQPKATVLVFFPEFTYIQHKLKFNMKTHCIIWSSCLVPSY